MPVDAVIDTYNTRTAALRAQVAAFVASQYDDLSSWRPADIARFAAAVAPMVEAGQIRQAALTDGYLAAVETAALGAPVKPLGIPRKTVSDLSMRGVATVEVFSRVGPTVWGALAGGATLTSAVTQGRTQAGTLVATDMQMSSQHASRYVLSRKPGVTGYRRVLTGAHACRLCRAAAFKVHGKMDLLPVHPGCSCSVAAIYGKEDPGAKVNDRVIMPEDDIAIVVHDDPERGPQLFIAPTD